jgi:hypothetical protein
MDSPQILYLTKSEVESAGLTMSEIISLVEIAFMEKGQGQRGNAPQAGHPSWW